MAQCNIQAAIKIIQDLEKQAVIPKNSNLNKTEKMFIKNKAAVLKELSNRVDLARKIASKVTSFSETTDSLNIYSKVKPFIESSKESKKEENIYKPYEEFVVTEEMFDTPIVMTLQEFSDAIPEISSYADQNRDTTKDSAENMLFAKVIKAYLKQANDRSINVVITDKIKLKGKDNESRGFYKSNTNTITIATNPSEDASGGSLASTTKVLLHELVHAISLQTLKESPAMMDQVVKLKEDAIKRYTKLNGKPPSLKEGSDTYGLSNSAEFLAETLTSLDFQIMLSTLGEGYKTTVGKRVKQIFKRLVILVKNKLGIQLSENTLLEEALDLADKVITSDLSNTDSDWLQKNNQDIREAGETKEVKENKKEPFEPYKITDTFSTNEGQTDAINSMKDWYSNTQKETFLLTGRGGTGKTTVINVLLKELGLRPDDVMFAAPTNKAKKVIKKANENNTYKASKYKTVASILKLKKKTDRKTGKVTFEVNKYDKEKTILPKVLVIDEASMLHSDNYFRLIEEIGSDTRIIFMGDSSQMPPIGDTKAPIRSIVFEANQDTTANLSELMRQAEGSPIIEVTNFIIDVVDSVEKRLFSNKMTLSEVKEKLLDVKFRIGRLHNFDAKKNEGAIVTKNDFSFLVKSFVNDFKKDPKNTKIIHYNKHSNPKTDEKIKLVRKEIYGTKSLEKEYIKGEPIVLNGPLLIFAENNEEDEFLDNGEEFTVVSSQIIEKRIDYRVGKEDVFTTEGTIQVHELTVKDYINDEIYVFDKPTGDYASVEKFVQSEIRILQDKKDRKLLRQDPTIGYQILNVLATEAAYGYVINAHKAQGSTYNNVYVDLGNMLFQEYADANSIAKSLYVATSRPRKKLVMFDSTDSQNSGILGDEQIDLRNFNNNIVLDANSNEVNDIISKDDKCR